MKLEKICTSLEMSKQLDKVGVKLPTCLWWRINDLGTDKTRVQLTRETPQPARKQLKGGHLYMGCLRYYSAYTFQQIWGVLPVVIPGVIDDDLTLYESQLCYRYRQSPPIVSYGVQHLPNAAAKALYYHRE